jgi:hypothetical protein
MVEKKTRTKDIFFFKKNSETRIQHKSSNIYKDSLSTLIVHSILLKKIVI